MKQFKTIMIFLILVVLIISCSKKEKKEADETVIVTSDTSDPNKYKYLSVIPKLKTVGPMAGTFSISVSSNTNWIALSDKSWCTISPSSGVNDGDIVVHFPNNTDTSNRVANIIVNMAENDLYPFNVTITQTGLKIISIDFNGSLYVFPYDNSNGINWNNGKDTLINSVSSTNGKTNTSLIVSVQGVGSYAAYLCDTLNALGYDDWYLPALDELNAIFTNKEIINELNSIYYWSSTEYTNQYSMYQGFFGSGIQSMQSKFNSYSVRCVRR